MVKRITRATLDIGIVTTVWGNYGRFLPEWAKTICNLNRQPTIVTVVIAGETPNNAPRIWSRQCAPLLNGKGIPWRLFQLPKHHNMGRTRNEAVKRTHTEWIMHLDVDDGLLPHCLDDVAALSYWYDYISLGMQIQGRRRKQLLFRPTIKGIKEGRRMGTTVSPYRRSLWEQLPYLEFEEEIGSVDGALYVGFAHLGARFVGSRRVCTIHNKWKGSFFESLTPEQIELREQRRVLLNKDINEFYKYYQRGIPEIIGEEKSHDWR